MSTQVTVTLPDAVFANALRLARLTQRDVADVLSDILTLSLPILPESAELPVQLATLGDSEVLALTTIELPLTQDRRLSELLARQQAAELTDAEQSELSSLMQMYREGLLRKAEALAEAVRRGIHEPLMP